MQSKEKADFVIELYLIFKNTGTSIKNPYLNSFQNELEIFKLKIRIKNLIKI